MHISTEHTWSLQHMGKHFASQLEHSEKHLVSEPLHVWQRTNEIDIKAPNSSGQIQRNHLHSLFPIGLRLSPMCWPFLRNVGGLANDQNGSSRENVQGCLSGLTFMVWSRWCLWRLRSMLHEIMPIRWDIPIASKYAYKQSEVEVSFHFPPSILVIINKGRYKSLNQLHISYKSRPQRCVQCEKIGDWTSNYNYHRPMT